MSNDKCSKCGHKESSIESILRNDDEVELTINSKMGLSWPTDSPIIKEERLVRGRPSENEELKKFLEKRMS